MQRRGRRVRTCGAWGTSAWWERASPPPDLNLGRPGFDVLFEECNGPPLRVEPRFPDRPFDEPQMAAPSGQLHLDGAGRRPRHASGRNEGIVLGGDEQERDSHALDVIGAGALRVIVLGAGKAVEPRRQRVVELEQRPCAADALLVRGTRKLAELLQRLALQRVKESRPVEPGPEPGTVEGPRAEREIERYAECHRRSDLARRGIAEFTQPLHEDVAAQGKAGEHDAVGLVLRAADQLRQVARLSGVIRADEPVHVAGRSEEHTSELQSLAYLVCRLLLEKKKHYKLSIVGELL